MNELAINVCAVTGVFSIYFALRIYFLHFLPRRKKHDHQYRPD